MQKGNAEPHLQVSPVFGVGCLCSDSKEAAVPSEEVRWAGSWYIGAGRTREGEGFCCSEFPERPLESSKEGRETSRVMWEGNGAGRCMKGTQTAKHRGRRAVHAGRDAAVRGQDEGRSRERQAGGDLPEGLQGRANEEGSARGLHTGHTPQGQLPPRCERTTEPRLLCRGTRLSRETGVRWRRAT